MSQQYRTKYIMLVISTIPHWYLGYLDNMLVILKMSHWNLDGISLTGLLRLCIWLPWLFYDISPICYSCLRNISLKLICSLSRWHLTCISVILKISHWYLGYIDDISPISRLSRRYLTDILVISTISWLSQWYLSVITTISHWYLCYHESTSLIFWFY